MWDLTVPGNNDHDFYVESRTKPSWPDIVSAGQRVQRMQARRPHRPNAVDLARPLGPLRAVWRSAGAAPGLIMKLVMIAKGFYRDGRVCY